jgi:hypothetical protein
MASEQAKRELATQARLGLTERVLYRPGRAGLLPREIDAQVNRLPSQEVGHSRTMVYTVTALNDEVLGIPSDPRLSDTGTDRIELADRIGGELAPKAVGRFTSQDNDWVTLEVH